MNAYRSYLKDNGWFDPKNFDDKEIINPSISMKHAMSGGFSIILYGGTHNMRCKEGILHQGNAVRVILGRDMVALWHERTYHSGTKSRFDKCRSKGRYGFHINKQDTDQSP